jgi:CheY-like chemotaxis protein
LSSRTTEAIGGSLAGCSRTPSARKSWSKRLAAEADGLARAQRRPAVDLILLDLNLPDMSGFDVLRHLRAELEDRGSAGGGLDELTGKRRRAPRLRMWSQFLRLEIAESPTK